MNLIHAILKYHPERQKPFRQPVRTAPENFQETSDLGLTLNAKRLKQRIKKPTHRGFSCSYF